MTFFEEMVIITIDGRTVKFGKGSVCFTEDTILIHTNNPDPGKDGHQDFFFIKRNVVAYSYKYEEE